MAQNQWKVVSLATCATFSALMTVQAAAQPLGAALGGAGLSGGGSGDFLSSSSSESSGSEMTLGMNGGDQGGSSNPQGGSGESASSSGPLPGLGGDEGGRENSPFARIEDRAEGNDASSSGGDTEREGGVEGSASAEAESGEEEGSGQSPFAANQESGSEGESLSLTQDEDESGSGDGSPLSGSQGDEGSVFTENEAGGDNALLPAQNDESEGGSDSSLGAQDEGDQGGDQQSPLAQDEQSEGEDEESSNRVDGAVIVRNEEEQPDPENELRNPSVFLRYTLAEDHASVRNCVAAGEICRAQFSFIAAGEESQHESGLRVWLNEEQVIPPPEEEEQNGGGEEGQSPFAGLQEEGGNGEGEEEQSPLAQGEEQNGDSEEQQSPLAQNGEEQNGSEEESSNRQDGLVMFRQERDGASGDDEFRHPSLFVHYTLSDNLQSVRGCFAAGEQCRLSSSTVFRDGEFERMRINDQFIVGEDRPPREEDESEHRPGH